MIVRSRRGGIPVVLKSRLVACLLGVLTIIGSLVTVPTGPASAQGTSSWIYGWGSDSSGQLCGSTADTPASLPAGVSPVQISTGASHSLIIGSNGIVYACGDNTQGELGNGTTQSSSSPTPVELPALAPTDYWTSVAAGDDASFALSESGVLYAWGDDTFGELGIEQSDTSTCAPLPYNSTPTPCSLVPQQVEMPTSPTGAPLTWQSISAGAQLWIGALDSAGNAWAWGDDAVDQIPVASTQPSPTTPLAFPYGNQSQCGTGPYTCITTPALVAMPAGVSFTTLCVAESHMLALDTNGNAWAWGYGGGGWGGVNGPWGQVLPVPMPAGVTFTQISAGGFDSMAIGSDGNLYMWGDNSFGQLGYSETGIMNQSPQLDPNINSGSTPIAPAYIADGGDFSELLATTGEVYTWGYDEAGQLGPGTITQPDLLNDTGLQAQLPSGPSSPAFTPLSAGADYTLIISGNPPPWAAPSDVEAANADNSTNPPTPGLVRVEWTAPTSPSPLTSYQVIPDPPCPACTGLTVQGNPPATSTLVGGLTDSTTYTFTVYAISAAGTSPSSSPSNPATPESDLYVTTTALPEAALFTRYSTTLVAGGTLSQPPYTWSLASGTLPLGFALSSRGVVSGTPRTTGTWSFDVTVHDTRTTSHPEQSSSQSLTLTVVQPVPTVTEVSPSSGPGAGWTKVTVSGNALESASAVFFGSVAAIDVTVNTEGTSLTALAPSGSGTVDVNVVTPSGTSATSAADQYTYALPTVTSVTPDTGPPAGGAPVTITGQDLQAASVYFGPNQATVISINHSGTSITAYPPTGVGSVPVQVMTPAGMNTTNPPLYAYTGAAKSGYVAATGSFECTSGEAGVSFMPGMPLDAPVSGSWNISIRTMQCHAVNGSNVTSATFEGEGGGWITPPNDSCATLADGSIPVSGTLQINWVDAHAGSDHLLPSDIHISDLTLNSFSGSSSNPSIDWTGSLVGGSFAGTSSGVLEATDTVGDILSGDPNAPYYGSCSSNDLAFVPLTLTVSG